jgi:hypothetical protein
LEALTLHESKLQNDPSTKKGTKRYWKTVVAAFRKSWPALLTSELRRVTVEQCEDWAGKAVKAMSPMRFNNSLLVLKSMFRIAVKRGVRRTNPALAIKRAKVRRKDLSGKLPNEERFSKWVTALRKQAVVHPTTAPIWWNFSPTPGCGLANPIMCFGSTVISRRVKSLSPALLKTEQKTVLSGVSR